METQRAERGDPKLKVGDDCWRIVRASSKAASSRPYKRSPSADETTSIVRCRVVDPKNCVVGMKDGIVWTYDVDDKPDAAYVTHLTEDGKSEGGSVAVSADEVRRGNLVVQCPAAYDGESNNTALPYQDRLHVLHNLRTRHRQHKYQTFTADMVIVSNPFQDISATEYSEEQMEKYRKSAADKRPEPHIYWIAEHAFRACVAGEPQAIIIKGDSGAGKTENAKYIMQYVVWRAEQASGAAAAAEIGGASLAERVLAVNLVLEALGNARTLRNNNSSRFGKLTRLFLSPSGAIQYDRPPPTPLSSRWWHRRWPAHTAGGTHTQKRERDELSTRTHCCCRASTTTAAAFVPPIAHLLLLRACLSRAVQASQHRDVPDGEVSTRYKASAPW